MIGLCFIHKQGYQPSRLARSTPGNDWQHHIPETYFRKPTFCNNIFIPSLFITYNPGSDILPSLNDNEPKTTAHTIKQQKPIMLESTKSFVEHKIMKLISGVHSALRHSAGNLMFNFLLTETLFDPCENHQITNDCK